MCMHLKGKSSMCLIHLPPCAASALWANGRTESHPTRAKRHLQVSCKTDGGMSCWSLLVSPAELFFFWLSYWGEFQRNAYFFIILFILFHFMNSKNFKVNFWFSRLLIIVAKLNPKIPWADRWGKITCSLLINHKPCSGNILYYVFQNYVIHFRSKPGILKSRCMYIGRIIHFK